MFIPGLLFSNYIADHSLEASTITTQPQTTEVVTVEKPVIDKGKGKDHEAFLYAIGFKESRNDYTCVNTLGYLGRYQFVPKTLRGLGYDVPDSVFLSNPKLQDQAMVSLLKDNKRMLRKYIQKYEGQIIKGITVTESGILAAAHLGGHRSIKKFLKTNGTNDRHDSYGTHISDYLQKFSGYKINV